MPMMVCGVWAAPVLTRDSAGSTATTFVSAFWPFRNLPQPVTVPPVPSPAMK